MFTYLILLVVGIIAATVVSMLFAKNRTLRLVLQIVFLAVIILLGYLLVESIMKPIRFNEELEKREDATIAKLKDIRKAQVAYKDKYEQYTGSFDTLLAFVAADSFELEKKIIVGEWITDEMTQSQAIEKGIIQISKSYVPVKDSLFGIDYPLDKLRFVPFTNNTVEFNMGAGELETMSKVKVDVFEAYALYNDLLNGMDKQLKINYIDERYQITNFEGLKVGSLTEATNNAGNWGEN